VCRSAPRAAVVADVERAAAAGFKEIVLTGVHLGSYGRDLSPASSLLELLDALDRGPHHVLFRISSLEPMDCTPAIVDRVARSGRFAPHFHLPLQHASDDVLRRMRRPHTLTDYRRTADEIRDRLPHASIGSDLIVGFPAERDEEAELTLRYLASSPLTYLHVFPYSDRPGTDAARLGERVPGATVRQRARALRDLGAELTRRFHLSQLGSVRPALTIEDGSIALTDNYLRVHIARGHPRNERVQVRLTATIGETLRGVVE
jgi:threonylcarbamoyladenosine tRNA methylthiotransferase MtaB